MKMGFIDFAKDFNCSLTADVDYVVAGAKRLTGSIWVGFVTR